MKTTETSEAIAKRMLRREYTYQQITRHGSGMFSVSVTKWNDGNTTLGANAKTITAAYRNIEQQWKRQASQD